MSVVTSTFQSAVAAAVRDFRSALGEDRVLTGADQLNEFRDPFQFASWDEFTASAVVMPETVEEVQEVLRIASRHGVPLWTHSTGRNNGYGGPAPRLDYIVGILPISARSFTHITMVIFDTEDEAQTRSAYDVCRRLVTEAAKLGYGEYRAHLDFMDLASEQYSFNHHAYRRFCETIKDAVDPQGILSPGKQGIWPAAMRPDRVVD